MKTCKKCNTEKAPDEFYNQKAYKDGLDPMCIICRKKSNKEYHDKHRQNVIDRSAQWRKDNLERDRAAKRAYYQKNKDKFKEYYKNKKKNEVRD